MNSFLGFIKVPVIQRAFQRIALIGYQTIVFILSFFRNVVNESNQKDSLQNAQDEPDTYLCDCVSLSVLLLMRVGPLGPFFMGRFSERGVLPVACSFSDCMADRSLLLFGVEPFRRLPRSDASDSVKRNLHDS